MQALKGWKTYLAIGAAAIALVAVNAFGVQIPGMAPDPHWVGELLALAGLGGLRDAVNSVSK